MQASFLLIIIFAIDAAHTAAKRSGLRRPWVLGGLTAMGFSLVLVSYELYARGILPSTFSSQLFLLLILLMGYELSLDVLRAGQLSRDLLESQQRMRLAANAADLSLWEWDIVRDEIWVTEKGRERTGIGASERIDFARFLQAIHPDDSEQTQQAVRHSLEDSGELESEYRVVARNGATRWVVARGQVERDADGKPVRLRGVSVDITQRKRAEQELAQSRNELAHIARVSTMGELAASVAHELNQPLGAILRNAEAAELFLQAPSPDLEEVRAILTDIRADEARAGAVIDRIRSMLKLREIEHTPLDLKLLAGEVVNLVRPEAEARKIQLALEPGSPPPLVRGDRAQLQQVLLNLLLNAMDAVNYSPNDRRRVSVCVRTAGSQVEAAVSDTGDGIPADKVAHVFESFFTTKPNGLGMGLVISRNIIKAHGGSIHWQNNPAGGATFCATLPVAEKENGP
jgi:PAS domain S-box-containing protein